jgi:hypothetical protein
MLIAIAAEKSDTLLNELTKHYPSAVGIGQVKERGLTGLVVKSG